MKTVYGSDKGYGEDADDGSASGAFDAFAAAIANMIAGTRSATVTCFETSSMWYLQWSS